jgi:hypothetical protein
MLSDLMEHAKADHSERLPAQDGDRAGFRESFAAESAGEEVGRTFSGRPSSLREQKIHFYLTKRHIKIFVISINLIMFKGIEN